MKCWGPLRDHNEWLSPYFSFSTSEGRDEDLKRCVVLSSVFLGGRIIHKIPEFQSHVHGESQTSVYMCGRKVSEIPRCRVQHRI